MSEAEIGGPSSEQGSELPPSAEVSPQPPQSTTHQRQHVPVRILFQTPCYKQFIKTNVIINFLTLQIRPVRATMSRTSQRRRQANPNMDAAMMAFMEDIRSMRRVESTDPFADPTNPDAIFLRNLYQHLSQIPPPKKMEVQMAIFNFTGLCIRAAMAGDPMPSYNYSYHQRPYQYTEPAPTTQSSQHIYAHHLYPQSNPMQYHQRPPTPAHNMPQSQVSPYSQPNTSSYESSSSQAHSFGSSSQGSNQYSKSPSYYQEL